jgi:hypothetical protein
MQSNRGLSSRHAYLVNGVASRTGSSSPVCFPLLRVLPSARFPTPESASLIPALP